MPKNFRTARAENVTLPLAALGEIPGKLAATVAVAARPRD